MTTFRLKVTQGPREILVGENPNTKSTIRLYPDNMEIANGIREPGTYTVTVEKVAPRAARIRRDYEDTSGFPSKGTECSRCGRCLNPVYPENDRCQNKLCGAILGRTVICSDLRDADGKPLVEG